MARDKLEAMTSEGYSKSAFAGRNGVDTSPALGNDGLMKHRLTLKELAAAAGVSIDAVKRMIPNLAGYEPHREASVSLEAVEQVRARRGKGRPRKIDPGSSQGHFPAFWFDGNEWFGWVRSQDDLAKLEAAYPEGRWRMAHRCDRSTDRANFGFRSEHLGGTVTLGEWLEQQGGER